MVRLTSKKICAEHLPAGFKLQKAGDRGYAILGPHGELPAPAVKTYGCVQAKTLKQYTLEEWGELLKTAMEECAERRREAREYNEYLERTGQWEERYSEGFYPIGSKVQWTNWDEY